MGFDIQGENYEETSGLSKLRHRESNYGEFSLNSRELLRIKNGPFRVIYKALSLDAFEMNKWIGCPCNKQMTGLDTLVINK